MASDSDWVADVRRWVESGAGASARGDRHAEAFTPGDVDDAELGYEAAQPALLARDWVDAAGA